MWGYVMLRVRCVPFVSPHEERDPGFLKFRCQELHLFPALVPEISRVPHGPGPLRGRGPQIGSTLRGQVEGNPPVATHDCFYR